MGGVGGAAALCCGDAPTPTALRVHTCPPAGSRGSDVCGGSGGAAALCCCDAPTPTALCVHTCPPAGSRGSGVCGGGVGGQQSCAAVGAPTRRLYMCTPAPNLRACRCSGSTSSWCVGGWAACWVEGAAGCLTGCVADVLCHEPPPPLDAYVPVGFARQPGAGHRAARRPPAQHPALQPRRARGVQPWACMRSGRGSERGGDGQLVLCLVDCRWLHRVAFSLMSLVQLPLPCSHPSVVCGNPCCWGLV